MGRGDIKTKKGKTFAGSFGKTRPAKPAKKAAVKKAAIFAATILTVMASCVVAVIMIIFKAAIK